MADEVPVSDVLCEAMEYLSKLGSNLRSRSENLKEKRIRKDKLKNFHAVQKAASRVLLICDLSKRSIENVETGVRKVLKMIDASQATISDGGKNKLSPQNVASESKDHFQYYEYRSRKIKVNKKVPLKHYLSVKVFAKRMTQSMIEKYPVYHHCKLYRLRKRNKIGKDKSDNKDSEHESKQEKEKKDKDEQDHPDDNNQDDNKHSDDQRNVSALAEHEADYNQDNTKDNGSKEKLRKDDKERKSDKQDLNNKSDNDSSDDNDKRTKRLSLARSISCDIESSHRKEMKMYSDSKDKPKENMVSDDKKEKNKRKRYKLVRIIESSDSDNEKLKNNDNASPIDSKDDDKDNDKFNSDKILGNNQNDFDIPCASKQMERQPDNSDQVLKNENRMDYSNLCYETSKQDCNATDSKEIRKPDINAEPSKPLIKCVSLTKLLKPDVLQVLKPVKRLSNENNLNSHQNVSEKQQKSRSAQRNLVSDKSLNDKSNNAQNIAQQKKRSEKRKERDEKFWIQKRREVAKFKPKTFFINIIKLQPLCCEFLRKHNLKQVIQNGDVIYKIKLDLDENIVNNQDNLQRDVIDKVKNALLIDSDSDRDSASPKNTLLQGSDSDKNPHKECSASNDSKTNPAGKDRQSTKIASYEHDKRTLLEESDSDKNPHEQCSASNDSKTNPAGKDRQSANSETFENVKNTLLEESDSDKNSHEECDASNYNKTSATGKDRQSAKSASYENDKSTLLEESDSDKNPHKECSASNDSKTNPAGKDRQSAKSESYENDKSTLLEESDSDKNPHEECSASNNSKINSTGKDRQSANSETFENVKNTLLEESDSDKKPHEECAASNDSKTNPSGTDRQSAKSTTYENVKNTLLEESDSDKNIYEESSVKTVSYNDKNPTTQELLMKSNEDYQINSADNCSKANEINNKNSQDKSCNEISKLVSRAHEKVDKMNYLQEQMEKIQDREMSPDCDADSSDCSVTYNNKRKKKLKKTPEKNHAMESMHAKKMLLTYSSSSDNDDEQLKSAISNIKNALLKEGSDEEDTKVIVSPKRGNEITSSDSDDITIRRVKKKRKSVKLQTPPADNESLKGDTVKDDAVSDNSSSSSDKMRRNRDKPSSSSGQNSDPQDDKDIDGLTNLNTLTRTRRGCDDSPASKTSNDSKKMPKVTSFISGEGLLDASITSDEGSDIGSEAGEDDLPPITLSGLNGSGIDHLAKEDLLEESDSSGNENKSEDVKKEDSSETDENVRKKRRKANMISSDSEAGSSKAKGPEVKVTDFEDSDEDNSDLNKRSKRRKKGSESDASAGSSDGGKKKRRRIVDLDSDGSGSDGENEGKNKHGRKNIRKVMGKNQLEEATKKAAREERERKARISERQKLYNNLEFDESGKPDEVVLDKVVLDFDPETKEPLIEVDRGLVKKLKPHQANGIKFMWDACFESVKRIKKDKGSGCILAHCMGLGKTLQVISLAHTLLSNSDLTGVNRVLVVCPLSTVLNWVNEIRMWLKHALKDKDIDVYELSRFKQNSERAFQLSQWLHHGGVCVLGYEMFRNLSADNPKKFKKKMLKNFQESLVDPGPDLVVCDEGHLLKNEKTSLSQSMNRVRTLRRIVLTGTPLQNNLKEYYCMVQFVKPNLLGKYNEYLNRFVNPITNGQYTDSTEHDIRIMKRRSHVLHKMLDGAVQRRDYGVLAPFLPPKHEYVLFITLTEVQTKLYQHYLDNYSRRPLAGKSSGFLFPDFQSLQRIWTHPLVLKYNSERYEIMQQKKRDREEEDSEGSLVDFIDDDSTPDESSSEELTDDSSDMSDDSRKKSKKKKAAKKSKSKDGKASTRRGTRANPIELNSEEEEPVPESLEVKNDNPTEWWIPMVTEDEIEDVRNSHKLVLLLEILRQCEAIGDKLLVFSQSLYSLDLIEHFLGKVDEATQEGRIDEKLGGHVGSWSPGVDYFRLDGSTSCENRSIWCKNFNREDNPRARLFLISTRAGGLGINLVAANRVVIFDVSWNPSHDVQSIFRVYRFGQKKPCYVYRFLAMGTMEEKIYERQVTKQAISKRVIDEQQIDRHYAENDLAELYKFEPQPPSPRPVPLVPKDRLFAEMLKEHEKAIYKFHEHDSLLENKEEETLSEEERKAAWDDFENEKNRPPPVPFASAWPMHNGMVPNLLAQQQQQLATAALASMLRKDMPNVTDDQIRSMMPLIYAANPTMFGGYDYGLMQKLNEMYKYTQPQGMMNPAMMNQVMNAGGAGGMGGSGTSGLQYEPPWQRQQQQQQQMRLQQLQQYNNSMGAKFYAGGLGSRDPIAMALQQQRAREMMLGERGGRPRGRPPLQARASPAASSGDVVNLDSD